MELRQELSTPPLDVELATVRAWAVWQTEVERRIMPRFARREARRRAWAYALLTVLRDAHLPAPPPLKKMRRSSTRGSLTAFKTSRGLVCR